MVEVEEGAAVGPIGHGGETLLQEGVERLGGSSVDGDIEGHWLGFSHGGTPSTCSGQERARREGVVDFLAADERGFDADAWRQTWINREELGEREGVDLVF